MPMTPTVRTFRAPDAAAALMAVKEALGPDAVIVSTRSIGGGLFRRPEIEVTAALEAAPAALAPPPPPPPPAAPPAAARPPEARPKPFAPPEPAAPPRPQDDPLQDEMRMLRRSVEEARRALASLTQEARVGRDLQLLPAAAQVMSRLVDRGVELVLAEELVRSALLAAPAQPERLLLSVKDLLGERLVPCQAPWLQERRTVLAAVGPTGAGKTTTLAKIAARALLETRKRVGFVTLDTYRIGAAEQLARYGEIMEAPVLVARNRAEFVDAVARLSDRDLVLVDTAGRSTAADLAEQASLVRAVPRIEVHLVVSAATGPLELAAVADRYRPFSPDRLAVTKIDEAVAPGSILSAAVRVRRPIACVADGQRVPEDLHAFTGPQLVDLVAGSAPASA